MAATVAAPTPWLYPIHVDASPVPDHPSRWLWLVKWVLLIPHVVVLSLLWVAFVVLSVAAFVSILVTGIYPRTIFDFNVGVLRWSWRVTYYGYGALGTDQYPPFTLEDVPDYPAHLEVDYPEHLSRGLVLVKWWLLALPHYLVLALLVGAGATIGERTDRLTYQWQGGLVAVLTLVAGVLLLVAGTYPRGLYDLLLGLNRWVLRVTAYAALMTDTYPPFRLDQGGPDLAAGVAVGVERTTSRAPTARATSWTGPRAAGAVVGALAVAVAVGLTTAGSALLIGNAFLREDGFVTSPERLVSSTGYAIATEPALLEGTALDIGLGQVRLRAELPEGQSVFLGIAPAQDAAAYLDGVEHGVLSGVRTMDLRDVPGDRPAGRPADQDIWAASVTGTGVQVLETTPQEGRWVAVVMRTDAAAGLQARVDVGATLPWLPAAGTAALLTGLALLVGGVVVLLLVLGRAGRPAA